MKFTFVLLIIMSLILFITVKNKKLPLILLLLTTLGLMILYPKVSLEAAKEGINLSLFLVIPSLIPFFIINDMLIALRVPDNIARIFSPVARFLFGTSGYGAYVFIMSIFSGYPAGAKIAAQLIENKKIPPQEGTKILTFSSTSGPLFIIGAVGAGMLGSTSAGYILFAAHILGAILNGIVLRFFFPRSNKRNDISKINNQVSPPLGLMLSKAISNTLVTCGYIGGYIILFSVVIALLKEIKFFHLLTFLMNRILFIPEGISGYLSSLLETSLEISNGCKIISHLSASFEIKMVMASFIIAFSGLSIIGQAVSLIAKTGINLKVYFASKISQGVFSSAACLLLMRLGNFTIKTSAPAWPGLYVTLPYILIILLIILMILNILSSKLLSSKKYRAL